MSIDISNEIEARLTEEARRLGITIDALLERLMSERGAAAHLGHGGSASEVPILHLGAMGPLYRRDFYEDARQ
jgi:hypothetical protein